MKIIRVFPKKTAFTPTDEYCYFDNPGMFIPDHDEVHVCCVFTWDKQKAEELKFQWQGATNKPVKIGGPAYDDPGKDFIPGRYIKNGVTITSRGCVNNCKFCFVPKREGKLRELKVQPGNIIQDNNFLACSKQHKEKVYEMLKTQHKISFRGGLEAARLSDWDIEQMRGLKISDLWLACDSKERIKPFINAVEKLHRAGFSQNKIRCYVLIGDDRQENEERLRAVFEAGALPFAQLFQPVERIEYSQQWKHFSRKWSRPAIYKSMFKKASK